MGNEEKKYVYLDHNVLNDMHDGHERVIRDYLEESQLQVVYSDQNIDEITASVRRKDYFVDVLSSLGALHINSPLDKNWKPTNELIVQEKPPNDRIIELEEARAGTEEIGDHIDMLTAIFGGGGADNIVSDALSQLEAAKKMVDESLAEHPEFAHLIDVTSLEAKLEEAKAGINTQLAELEKELKENGSPFVEANIKKHLGYSMNEISGVVGPDVIKKLWKMVGPKLGGYDSIEEYQAAVISASGEKFGLHGTEQQTVIQRANDLYLWLNIIGFHRDEKMGKPRRMKASAADMNHASYAMTCCTHFICRDKRLRYKAEAIYEHLDVGIEVLNPQDLYETAKV